MTPRKRRARKRTGCTRSLCLFCNFSVTLLCIRLRRFIAAAHAGIVLLPAETEVRRDHGGRVLAVERYLVHGEYPADLSKGEKANLRRKCKNFRLKDGLQTLLKKCVQSIDDRKRIIESCHARFGGK